MYTKTRIEKWLLDNCRMVPSEEYAPGTGLKNIHHKIYRRGQNILKTEVIRGLTEFYAEPRNIIDIWNGSEKGFFAAPGLSDIEKEFISAYVQYEGTEFIPTTKAIAQKHNLSAKVYKPRWGNQGPEDIFGRTGQRGYYMPPSLCFLHIIKFHYPHSEAAILFPGGNQMPPFVMSVIKPLIPPLVFKYAAYAPTGNDRVISREDRLADFAAVVRFAGSEQLKVKDSTFDISKAKLAKMVEYIGFDEVCDNNGKFGAPKEVRRNNDFKVATPLFALAANCGLVDINRDGAVSPGKNAVELLSKSPRELARHIFNSYTAENKIYETRYLTYISVYNGDWSVKWSLCRKPIIDLLKGCPVGQFVKFEDFDEYASILRGDFFRKLLDCAVIIKGYDFGYDYYPGSYSPDWDECEARLIAQILSFLGAIGAVDIAYTENVPRIKYADDDFGVGIAGFRVNNLGAWLLGLAKEYDGPQTAAIQSADGGLLVQPDHTVIITGLRSRIEHEIYLSQFMTKVSNDANVAIYKIDFPSMVKASGQKIGPGQVKAYLKEASEKPLPENVARSFDDWQAKVGRVKIRTVTVLETDDRLLLEELKSVKGIADSVVDEINSAVVIHDSWAKKVKALAEKNGWLVEL